MKLSTRSQYAITAVLELALNQGKKSVTLLEIARMEDISLSYLEQLFTQLRQHGLVKGRRGPGGGYTLARDPEDITVAEIVTAVDSSSTVNTADSDPSKGITSAHLWQHLSNKIHNYMCRITIAQIVAIAKSDDEKAADTDADVMDMDQFKNSA